uniref:Cilia- and flagella-associated protein 157 n=1 Tax=Chromera velia CCMP2878 TaxID=1169474 RepID=A0A0G4I2H3_9ALVE|eukprot:Cvel_10331.t1-p1 / transcript=Cvel_10331.t1 / gene=Cvel_10331 / organism=Chromera_velia_CCMP2878 / gene_product=hypothetical protein / transcript_product=hypothetical protein / location=Cvel_scaffold620:49222-58487(+) / protein_length=598 / sequence_SO=supercontig / SO=protein_coding / is_pseudo=false
MRLLWHMGFQTVTERFEEQALREANAVLSVSDLLTEKKDNSDAYKQLASELVQTKKAHGTWNDLNAKVVDLERKLEQERERHHLAVSYADKRALVLFEQQKATFIRRFKEREEQIRKKTSESIDMTTKRTQVENDQMVLELSLQAKQSAEVQSANEFLVREVQRLKAEASVHRAVERGLAAKVSRMGRQLRVFQKREDAALLESQGEAGGGGGTMEALKVNINGAAPAGSGLGNSNGGGGSMVPLSERIREGDPLGDDELHAECDAQILELAQALERTKRDFAAFKNDHDVLGKLQDDSARLLLCALLEAAPSLRRATENSESPLAGLSLTEEQRNKFFALLLEKLSESLCEACRPKDKQGATLPDVDRFFLLHGTLELLKPQLTKPSRTLGIQTDGDGGDTGLSSCHFFHAGPSRLSSGILEMDFSCFLCTTVLHAWQAVLPFKNALHSRLISLSPPIQGTNEAGPAAAPHTVAALDRAGALRQERAVTAREHFAAVLSAPGKPGGNRLGAGGRGRRIREVSPLNLREKPPGGPLSGPIVGSSPPLERERGGAQTHRGGGGRNGSANLFTFFSLTNPDLFVLAEHREEEKKSDWGRW